jgi:hypothetical protein
LNKEEEVTDALKKKLSFGAKANSKAKRQLEAASHAHEQAQAQGGGIPEDEI